MKTQPVRILLTSVLTAVFIWGVIAGLAVLRVTEPSREPTVEQSEVTP